MKKLAIVASSVALSAMPVVGVFATDVTTQVDTLEITIDKVCSLGYMDPATGEHAGENINVTGVAHAPGDGAWSENTLSKTMSTGTFTTNLGTTTLGVYCNNENGYTIATTNAGSLAGTTQKTGGTAIADVIEFDADGTIDANTTGWSYKVAAGTAASQRGEVKNSHTGWANTTAAEGGAQPNGVIAGSKTNAPKTTENAGDFYSITYGVGIDNTQSAGFYTGSITYTLAQL